MTAHYRAPGWLTRNVFNRLVALLTRHGVSGPGSSDEQLRAIAPDHPAFEVVPLS
ncbi:MAG: hypothetical protein JWP76_327 [Dactylosporangium sp.]|nr:hypothetical protein [Dactylosporangium sp.]